MPDQNHTDTKMQVIPGLAKSTGSRCRFITRNKEKNSKSNRSRTIAAQAPAHNAPRRAIDLEKPDSIWMNLAPK